MFSWKNDGRKASATAEVLEYRGKVAAMDRSQAVVEFDLDGNVLYANKNFLSLINLSAEDLVGRHHGMLVEAEVRDSREHGEFWSRLRQGEYFSGKYKRIAKGGRVIWIQGAYSPILDAEGKPSKVILLASDVTAFEEQREALAAQSKQASMLQEQHDAASADQQQAALGQQQILASLTEGLDRLSDGDLQFRLVDSFPPQYAGLRTSFNTALQKLSETMSIVTDNATAIHSGTQEISSASDDLARRTEQQAASLEETTAALGEITATVKKTSEGANHALQVVSMARRDVEQSGAVVSRAVDAMGEIEKSSSQIGQIIGVIDEIAFQTNLLALNAGVEAARAGDAGRGFAVVASEVRALAQRSAEAAKEIKALILASSRQVTTGVDLVGQTGKALDGFTVQIAEINDVVATIASSAQEQATALEQINTAVVQMDQVTQQNAAMVEEATAASHALAQEADVLARLVSHFQTGQTAPAPAHRGFDAKPAAKPKFAPVVALKSIGRGGAARKPAPAPVPVAAADDWEEF